MKKLLTFLSIFFIFTMTVNAAGKYTLKDLGLSISIPENLIVITRDQYPSDETLEELSINKEFIDNYFKNNKDVSVNAFDGTYEMFLRSVDVDSKVNLLDFKTKDYNDFVKELKKKTGTDKYENLEVNGLKYVYTSYIDKNVQGFHIYEFITVVNSKAITITFQQKDNDFTADQIAEFNTIMKSIKFDKINKSKYENSILNTALWGALIGGIVGGIAQMVNSKKKKQVQEQNNTNL